MTLDELQRLSPTQAMQAAAKELSLPDNFFDRMWSQESGRGASMRSQAGAEGHFQIMPKTRAAFEQRDSRAYDPDNFYDGLYLASKAMQENLTKFKDPVDATRAYNSGWDRSRWNNPETVGYVNALWGSGAPTAQRDPSWPTLPTLKEPKAPKTVGPRDQLAMSLLDGLSSPADNETARTQYEQGQAADAAEIARKDTVSTGDVVHDALRDPTVMTGWRAMARFGEDNRQPDPNYDYMARRDKIEAGMSEEERQFLRENAVSQTTEQQALADIQYQRGLDKTYSDAGPVRSTFGHLAAGLADPAGWAAGLGAGKAFELANIGHAAMIAAGRPAAAVASLAAENAAANVALTGASDALGEVKTGADYASAAAFGVMFSAPFSRGVFRQAADTAARDAARGIHERAVGEQVDQVASVMKDEPGLTPTQVARKVEEQQADLVDRTVRESTAPQRMDSVIPEDVRQSMEREFTGEPDPATPKPPEAAKERPEADLTPPEQPNIIEQLRKGDVTRKVTDTSGAEIKLSWVPEPNKLKPHGNLGETLDALQTHPTATIVEKRVAQYLKRVMSDDGLAIDIRFSLRDARSNMNSDGGVNINGITSGIQKNPSDLTAQVHGLTQYGIYSVLHEVAHAATWHRINAWETAAGKLPATARKTLAQFQDLFDRYKETVDNGLPTATEDHGAKYAAKDLHEFAAQILSDSETRQVLSVMPGKPVAGKASTALREVMSLFRRILGLDKTPTAFHEAAKLVDQIIALPVDNIHFKDGTPVFAATDVSGKPNPAAAQRSRDTWAERMTEHAKQYLAQHPIIPERLNVFTAKIGGVSDGLRLAGSKNPIMQLVASLVTETTTGAAGRANNVAIRSRNLHTKFVGNALLDYDNAYTVFRNKAGGGVVEDMWAGDVRRKFDKQVYEETLSRKLANYTPSRDKSVVEAADALEGLFDRSRNAQVDAGVLGFAHLPESSRGYMPQALDGVKLQAATAADLGLLHDALADQFVERLGWDKKFARDFAPFYTERVRRRAMGEKNIDGLAAGGDGLQVVRDTLDEMGQDPGLVDRGLAAQSSQGQGHTKARLDVDLLQNLRPGLRMMDFYVTNPLVLARSYSKRSAGTVALTEAGIHGIRGVRELRQAALTRLDGAPPPVPDGMTRIYHGSAQKGRYDGKAWFSTDRKYAENYRGGAELQYADYPTEKLNSIADPDGYGQTVDKGFTVNLELDSSETGLRRPMRSDSVEQPSHIELGAFDRVMSEILGTPVAGQVVSAGATNLSMLVTLQRLGGLVFTQAAETFNMIQHTGMRSLLNGVPRMAEMMGEVGRLKRGLPSGNHILTSLETYGGEIGMEGYKMVAPLDAPDAALRQYVDQPGLVSRLLRVGGHLQSKISGFRGLLAAQHRMVAEQIVMKAARYVRDGKSDIALRDMGITPEIAASLKGDLDRVAKWDSMDRLQEFDLSQVTDARTAEAFVQAVHRGTAQIIQGTFVGERNAWFHNDYLKMLLQLRTFGLTATEKQWGRQRMNHGYAYASGLMLGQMAMALPIYFAKVQLMSAGMNDEAKRKFIKQNLTPGAMVKATMNYASITGNTGDVLELLTGIAGGWTKNQNTKDLLGVGAQPTSVRSIAPVAATVDSMLGVASGRTNLHNSLKQLPFSNLWYIAPGINILKKD